MRRFFTLYLPPILGAIIIILKVPEVDKWIKTHYVQGSFVIALILVGCTLLNHLITVVSPFKKFERIEKNKWILIDSSFNGLHASLFPGYRVLANVMRPKRVLYSCLEPIEANTVMQKLNRFYKRLYVKQLSIEWNSNNHAIDRRVKLTTKQGASGMAYTQGKPVIIKMSESINDLNLNAKQIAAISGNGFIISYPIYAFDERYSRLSNKKIIGVVNFSCSNLEAEEIVSSPINRETLTEKIVEFSKICSLIS